MSASPGIHSNTLLTGLPLVGRSGVIVAPGGRPATSSVTSSPASSSDAVISKLIVLPDWTTTLAPHWAPTGTIRGPRRGGPNTVGCRHSSAVQVSKLSLYGKPLMLFQEPLPAWVRFRYGQ